MTVDHLALLGPETLSESCPPLEGRYRSRQSSEDPGAKARGRGPWRLSPGVHRMERLSCLPSPEQVCRLFLSLVLKALTGH